MSQLAATLDGLKRSIEYLQDYIDIAGLKMYQEEMARVINYNAEMEANRYLKRKIYDAYSRFQSRAIPIPRFPSLPTTLPKVCYVFFFCILIIDALLSSNPLTRPLTQCSLVMNTL